MNSTTYLVVIGILAVITLALAYGCIMLQNESRHYREMYRLADELLKRHGEQTLKIVNDLDDHVRDKYGKILDIMSQSLDADKKYGEATRDNMLALSKLIKDDHERLLDRETKLHESVVQFCEAEDARLTQITDYIREMHATDYDSCPAKSEPEYIKNSNNCWKWQECSSCKWFEKDVSIYGPCINCEWSATTLPSYYEEVSTNETN